MALELITALVESIGEPTAKVEQVIVGLKVVGVKIDGKWGLSTIPIFKPTESSHRFLIKESGFLHKKTPKELINLIYSQNPLEASIGMAAINSVLGVPKSENIIEANGFDYIIPIITDKRVTMVGHFPRCEQLREVVESLSVLELNPQEGDLPAEMAKDVIPQSNVLILTASTITNHTIDELLSLKREDCFVVLIGPTTPFSSVLARFGIHLLCGSIVVDEERFLLSITQGASAKELQGIKQLCYKLTPFYSST